MAQLGDKVYSYNYYGLPDRTRVWGTPNVGGYAALTYLNVWGLYMGPPISEFFTDGIYWEHDGTTSDNYGEPLDDTIALWHISKSASFACNAVFSAEIGDTLKPHYDVNIHNDNAPLAMCAVDTHGGAYGNFVRNPVERWAYDVSLECNGSYSAPIFDIVYNNFVWPNEDAPLREKITEAAQAALDARAAHPGSTLADLYDPLTMPPDLVKAHAHLDALIDKAYGLKPTATDSDRVALLFKLYAEKAK